MRFLFFDSAGAVLFERTDAERASVTHEQLSFQALFPYDGGKVIQSGMRVGFADALGSFQAFEIRKVRTLEPDHYQEITAESIAISELTDEFTEKKQWTNVTAGAALGSLLNNTGWEIGDNLASNTSSGDAGTGDVWNATRTIQQNWNVYILPRVTVGASGITHKYLDIVPAGGVWRGLRLSLEKNASEIGVIWDDSNLKTALYAFGQEKSGSPLTFKNVVWTATADHPAKPSGQTYLEDPDATAAYGRNGRPRFGYYQNASITDANVLLQKTWETLKTVNVPDVTIDCAVADLYRLGYADIPLRLHDLALVEIRPTGVVLHKELIQYSENLLDPSQSRVRIGVYIPNIVYINRQANKRSGGGRGSGGQTYMEYTTANNTVQLWNDSNGLHSLCVGTGAQLNPDGSLVIDPNTGKPVFIDTGDNMWSQIEQNKSSISLKVSKGDVSTQLAVECGNVSITGGNLTVDGYVSATEFDGLVANITGTGTAMHLYASYMSVTSSLDVGNITLNASSGLVSATKGYFADGVQIGNNTATWQSKTVVTGVDKSPGTSRQWAYWDGSSYQHTLAQSFLNNVTVSTTTIYYLGR